MIDLSGPVRDWSDRLLARFRDCHQNALRSRAWWKPPGWRGEPELLDRLAEMFGNPVDRTVVNGGVRQFTTSWAVGTAAAVVEAPTFADIPEILGSGARLRRTEWTCLTDGSLADEAPSTIWLTSPFRNPDGRSLDPVLTRAADEATGQGHTVVVNQVYRWFGDICSAPVAPATAWTVTSLAKMAGNGVRLGWATAPATDEVTRTLTSDGPPTAWQRAWARFLIPRNLQALWADCVEPTVEARQAFVCRTGELLGWQIHGGGPSLVLDCVDTDEVAAVALLAERGLRVSTGSAFGSPRACVRLSFSGTTVAEAEAAADRVASRARLFRPSGAPEASANGER